MLKQTFSLFKVDLPTFMTLTEEDLKELGINAFGARKKMLLTIQGELCLVFFCSFSSPVRLKASTVCILRYRSFAACCTSPHATPSLLARLSQYVSKLFFLDMIFRVTRTFPFADLKKNPNLETNQSSPVHSERPESSRSLFSDSNFNPLPFYRRHPIGIASKSGKW